MTRTQFDSWLAYHRAAFTGLSAWIAKLPEPGREREGEPHRVAVLAVWYAVLRDLDEADCRAATDRMAAGQVEEPKGYDRHKTVIAQEARRLASERTRRGPAAGTQPRWSAGEPTYECAECLDGGVVPIWHPASIEAACRRLDGQDRGCLGEPFTLYEAAARCTCRAGTAYRHLPAYDAGQFMRRDLTRRLRDSVDDVLAWAEEHRKMPVHDCFAEFG